MHTCIWCLAFRTLYLTSRVGVQRPKCGQCGRQENTSGMNGGRSRPDMANWWWRWWLWWLCQWCMWFSAHTERSRFVCPLWERKGKLHTVPFKIKFVERQWCSCCIILLPRTGEPENWSVSSHVASCQFLAEPVVSARLSYPALVRRNEILTYLYTTYTQ